MIRYMQDVYEYRRQMIGLRTCTVQAVTRPSNGTVAAAGALCNGGFMLYQETQLET